MRGHRGGGRRQLLSQDDEGSGVVTGKRKLTNRDIAMLLRPYFLPAGRDNRLRAFGSLALIAVAKRCGGRGR